MLYNLLKGFPSVPSWKCRTFRDEKNLVFEQQGSYNISENFEGLEGGRMWLHQGWVRLWVEILMIEVVGFGG